MIHWTNYGMNGWGYVLMSAISVLFWILLVAAVLILIRYQGDNSRRTQDGMSHRSTAEEILASRFARGEIDDDEYRRRLETLRGEGNSRIG